MDKIAKGEWISQQKNTYHSLYVSVVSSAYCHERWWIGDQEWFPFMVYNMLNNEYTKLYLN